MKSIFMSGSPRENVGKKDAKALRTKGLVPCVLYGGAEQIHFSADEKAFKPLIFTPDAHTVELEIAGKKYNAILQDVQYHAINDRLMHVDFLHVDASKPVVIAIPVAVHGIAPGVREGGKLLVKLRKMKVRALLNNLPDKINIDISHLEIGQSVKVEHLQAQNPELVFLDAPNVAVVSVSATRASRQAAEDAKK
ncbi:MAG: 50S ribosomal protein L25/general stress protein Ctc [Bacteroidia bacterium]|jgi:large subunit ribosomal protein L25